MLYVSPLKALAVDVERNLRAPLAGIAQVADGARRRLRHAGDRHPHRRHAAAERARFQREPADILITTPESLYLLLTSNAREALRSVDTVIIDEIHALVPTKRGAHLALSLERLEALLRRDRRSASACPRRSVRSTRSRAFSAASDAAPATGADQRRRGTARAVRHADGIGEIAARVRRARGAAALPAGHDRRRRPEEGAEAHDRGAGRGHGAARRRPTTFRAVRRRVGDSAAVDLGGDPSAAARADSRAPLDADLRQQPPAGRAAGRRAERARRRGAGALAPRIDRARAARSRSRTC